MSTKDQGKHPTPTKPRKLTYKQAKFVKAKAEGKTGVEAAREAYDVVDYNTANVIAVENLQKPTIQEALQAEFEKQGITLERIVAPIHRGLDAKKTVILGNGDEAFADVVDDHTVQLKASGMAAQFLGLHKNTEGGNTNYNFINVSRDDKGEYGI